MSTSSDITRQANSNLAFALRILPRGRRHDMQVFYAFCRVIDDLADDDQRPNEQRTAALESWKDGLTRGFPQPDALQQEVTDLIERADIPVTLLLDIIDGCLLDLKLDRIDNWDQLEDYIWKVSCTVGLVSIQLFGCQAPESRTYAIELAKALQLTNILRDLGEDYRQRRRIYLPLQDLHQFGYTEEDLAGQTYNEHFLALMDFEAKRAENCFLEASLHLTAQDHAALRPARIMSEIYQDILRQMRHDRFQVFDKRYQVPKSRKLLILLKHLLT